MSVSAHAAGAMQRGAVVGVGVNARAPTGRRMLSARRAYAALVFTISLASLDAPLALAMLTLNSYSVPGLRPVAV